MIIDTDKWREILFTLGQHKLRTGLTAFGVFWGIFMLTVLLGAGKGLENGVKGGFHTVPNMIWMWSGGATQIPYQGMPTGRTITLKQEDIDALVNNVAGVGTVKGQNTVGMWGGSAPLVVYGTESGAFPVQGSHEGFVGVHSIDVTEGRYINELDTSQRRKVAVIGARVREVLFAPGEDPIGKDVQINGISFLVIGVFKSRIGSNDPGEQEKVYIPNETLRQAFNQQGWIGSFIIQPSPGVSAEKIESDIINFMYERHKVSPQDVGVLRNFNLQREFEKIEGLFFAINAFSWVVAVGTIMAGAIGVGNIMLIVVKERTREIGVRKALGATPSSIITMIVQESILITAVAGYAGLVVGVFLLEGIASLLEAAGGDSGMFKSPEIDFANALTAIVVLIISGFLASLLPAAKAASVNPILALQDE